MDIHPRELIQTLREGDSQRIRPGLIHRYCANKGDVELLEVSTPELDDVVRTQDDYNRTN